MNKHKIIYLLLIPFLAFSSFSCDDEDFLTEEAETFYTTDNIYTSGVQVDQALYTLYQIDRRMRTANNAFGEGVFQGKGTDTFVAPTWRPTLNFSDYSQINADDSRIAAIFDEHYRMINQANTILETASRDDISFDSEDLKNYAMAQARFFRGRTYGSLAQLFGGVPIVETVVTEPRFDYQRASREEVYQFAIDDLLAAVPDLPETTEQPGRVVRGAAQHLLSEFYLSLGIETNNTTAYSQAIDYASQLIDGGIYSLMTDRFGTRADEPGKNVYWDLFRSGNVDYADGNLESIWTYQNDFGAFSAGDDNAVLQHPRYWIPAWRVIDGVTGIGSDVGGRGVAFFGPTDLTETIAWDPSISDGDVRGEESNIRRTIIFNQPDVTTTWEGIDYVAGDTVPQGLIDEANAARPGIVYPVYEKFTTDMFEGLDQGQNGSNIFRNRYAIRLAETILLRAEAYHRMGDNAAAANDINLIRSRAQCNTLATAGDIDIDYILDERARELMGEETRWHTLLRMGGTVAVDRIRAYVQHPWVEISLTFDFNLWPIPQSTIDRNTNVTMEQNPGWTR